MVEGPQRWGTKKSPNNRKGIRCAYLSGGGDEALIRSLFVFFWLPCGSDGFRNGAKLSDAIDDPLGLPPYDSVRDDSAEKLPVALSRGEGLAKLESVVARLNGSASLVLVSSSFLCDCACDEDSMEK
ncbi:hypothetical protein COL5a_001049 [Colletotrichum fioriniae]|uniref:uncharacterized protein n=1 Tax=Colletotrichum fioriniae TaxID=710243 RepID=UPI0032DA7B7D|nr:hypothetical protein COL5a_001049 [Colletotrichum fioriniae]KAJ3941508.1 hypothetical protein N0V96_008219 [Colletotrichum fioriniae]